MKSPAVKTFRATLQPSGMGLRSSFALVPFEVARAWPGLQVRRVKGEINGFAFRTALFRTASGTGFVVNKQMLAGARARQGDAVNIRLEPDLDERTDATPEELVRAMRGATGLRKWFERLPPGHRRWIAYSIVEPKSPEVRTRRAEDMAERLYLTMEGEKETPPILRVAFQGRPLAEQGWRAMTPTQRRNHLFLIFGSRSGPARQKKIQALIEAALERAGRDSGAETSRSRIGKAGARRLSDA